MCLHYNHNLLDLLESTCTTCEPQARETKANRSSSPTPSPTHQFLSSLCALSSEIFSKFFSSFNIPRTHKTPSPRERCLFVCLNFVAFSESIMQQLSNTSLSWLCMSLHACMLGWVSVCETEIPVCLGEVDLSPDDRCSSKKSWALASLLLLHPQQPRERGQGLHALEKFSYKCGWNIYNSLFHVSTAITTSPWW